MASVFVVFISGFSDRNLQASAKLRNLKVDALPCGATASAVCGRGPSEPCYYDDACDEQGLLGCNAGGFGARCRYCGFGEFASIPCPPELSTVHGDPIFKPNTTQKFWMPLHVPISLMSWKSSFGDDDNKTLVLWGIAYETPSTHDQWFESFHLTFAGKQAFNVSSGFSHLGTVKLMLDGSWVGPTDERKSGALNFTSSHSPISLELTKLPERLRIGNKRAQKLTIRMSNGYTFSIFSSKAAKFENATMQVKYLHLNLRLDSGIPRGATGVVPELAGVVPMGPDVKAMLTSQEISQKFLASAQERTRRQVKAQLNLVQLQTTSGLLTL